MDDVATFGIVDYCVFIAVLILSFAIGVATTIKGNKSPDEFLTGNRSFRPIPVGMSLLTSFVSAINFIGYTSEVYTYGLQISMLIPGCMIGIMLTMFITLPVIYPLQMTSTNEYFELRFKAPGLRFFIMLIVFFQAVLFMGVAVYAPSIALAAVTPLDFVSYIFMMGIVCTIYSAIGGIRAVIWTDVFQFFVMMIGLFAIVIVSVVQVGPSRIHSTAKEGGRLDLNFSPNIYENQNALNNFIMGVVIYTQLYGIAQINIQRVCAVPTIKDAQIVLGINVIGTAIVHFTIFYGALSTFATYAGCDPLQQGKIQKNDQILSYFITDKLGYIPGLSGLFVATLIATTLSTFSSVVNAQVAIIWKDCLVKMKYFSDVKPLTAVMINKIMTTLIGFAFIGTAILVSKTTSMIQLIFAIGGIAFGVIYGVFMLGMCFPRSNAKGAWSGLIVATGFMFWMYIGALSNASPNKPLPVSTDLCEYESQNETLFSILGNPTPLVTVINGTQSDVYETIEKESSPMMYLYGISYTYYPLIGPIVCVLVGVLVSYITGPSNPKDVDPRTILTYIRKYYYSDDILQNISLEMKQSS